VAVQIVVSEVCFNVYVVTQDLAIAKLLAHDIRDKLGVETSAFDIVGQIGWQYVMRHVDVFVLEVNASIMRGGLSPCEPRHWQYTLLLSVQWWLPERRVAG